MEETEVTIVPEGTVQKESTVQNTTQGDQQTAEAASPKSAERSTKSTSTAKHHQRKKKTTSGSAKSASNVEDQDTSDGSEADTEPDSDDDANTTQAADKSCKKPVGSKKDKDKGQSKKNGSGTKLSSSKKKSSKESSKKSSKQKRKKKAKDDLSDRDADSSSDPSDSDEDRGQDNVSGSKKSGLKSQFKALQLQVSQLQQQLSNQASVPAYSAPGYPLQCQYPHSAIFPQTNTSVSQPAGQRSRYGLRESRAAYKTPGSSPKDHLKGLGGLLGGDSSDESDQAAESKKKSKRPAFKRVDQVWDSKIHNFKLQDTADIDNESQYEDFIFHVRRTFDWEGKYRTTYVDIKSKLLRECLQDVIGNTDGVSLVDEVPKLNPHLLFLYLEDLRDHLRALKQAKPAGETKKARKKNQVRLDDKRKHLKVMIKYIDKDYETTKESLYPMLESGLITFDLLWALWKPNTLAYTTTYGCTSEPRVFRVDMATPQSSIVKGRFYAIDGKYVEFDGKRFGYGNMAVDVDEFQGARRITSLPCYPLQYHQNESKLRADLIERGKKFVNLSGVHYKSYQGIAFMKRKKNVIIKFNIQLSRVMIDPSTFRRINPNYSVSSVKPKDPDILSDTSDSDSESCCDCQDSDSDGVEKVKYVTKLFKDGNGEVQRARIPKDLLGSEPDQEELDKMPPKSGDGEGSEEEETFEFNDEEYLIASPVFLGFSFSEKHWLELSVSGIGEIKWNDKAWDSLVLEPETKDLIKALVKSRKYHAANTIDDVIQGKGKGLVTVLHGPPGTGKTLTAEGISELLKCPLYMASAGELGTDSRYLEAELQKILDTCHAWGAILLLDEADVFLEKRNMHDIQRNALVSIFLRQLEYFQGILFLTTNRVETFDEAFQSRIHIALRYDALDAKAKRTIFQMFLDRVRALGKLKVEPLKEDDWTYLSKQELNGREIKNVISSAQDLAVNKGEALSMRHIKQVLNVHANFGRDLRGGTGYEDAMRSYF
ncbi:hypothetical protein LCI18_014165 [Fusarium solani-melongenae]|uniref:Uncharacterized protein n=1 Tax=Fusarium solani subsp. cucurbitae TaxID=2747967 RepID=A0ACD3ZPS2_FUSSC|nr:hypothetical protein LCI18_014165 [Fusarium solani-melongenae]